MILKIFLGIILVCTGLRVVGRYLRKTRVYLIVNPDNLQKKVYTIKRKDILNVNEEKKSYIIETKKKVFCLEYSSYSKSDIFDYIDFQRIVKEVFIEKKFNTNTLTIRGKIELTAKDRDV